MTEQRPLNVQMLGDFALRYDGETLLSGYSRNNKAYYLLQYLLTHRGHGISREALMDLLYEQHDIDNPNNALKLIVHRLRKYLLSLGLPDREYVFFKNGKYGWNREVPCEVDVEVFETVIREAERGVLSTKERIELYGKAINLYKGDFLPALASEDWVAPLAVGGHRGRHQRCSRKLAQRH